MEAEVGIQRSDDGARNAGSLQKLEEARGGFSPEPSGRHAALTP